MLEEIDPNIDEDIDGHEIHFARPSDPVTRAHLDATMARLELRMRTYMNAALRPPWHLIWSAIGVFLALLTGIWALAINPIKDQLTLHTSELSEIHRDMKDLAVQNARTADSVDRLTRARELKEGSIR